MRHGGEIDHERSGPEIVDGGLFSLRACGQHRFFKLGDGKLPTSLTEGINRTPAIIKLAL
jgi:hypothetical protein